MNKNGIEKIANSNIYQIAILLFASILIILPACSRAKNKQKKNEPLTEKKIKIISSDFYLDSIKVQSFLQKLKMKNDVIMETTSFYKGRNYAYAWITNDGLTTVATNFYQQIQNDAISLADNSLHNKTLTSLFEEEQSNEKIFLKDTIKLQQLELLLTTSFFYYANKIYGGYTLNNKDLNWYIPRAKKNYTDLLNSLVTLKNNETIQEPVNDYYIKLKEKLKIFRSIETKGGYPTIASSKKAVSVEDSNSIIINVKKHLALVGDLKFNDSTILFTDSLANALSKYQKRMGITASTKIDAATINEMNKPIAERIKQIMINMERLRWVPIKMEQKYILVNIPEYKLHLFENNIPIWATPVVVGKAVKKTTIFRDEVSQIIINPYWNIPASITQKEIIPHIKGNRNYLSNNNMEVVSYKPYKVRQKPGSNNSLGRVKFLFPNNYNIYLHDTPSKNLFGQTKRAFSHGCIRVQDPFILAQYLLQNSDWTNKKIDSILQTNKEYNITLSPTIPVYIAYFTAWVDYTGQINFRNDVYQLDTKLAKEIFE